MVHERGGPFVTSAALLLAGGSGTRMATEQNKVYLAVGGRAVIDRPLEVLDRSAAVERIVLVIRPEDRPSADAAVARVVTSTPVHVVDGGATRTASELAGLAVIASVPGDECPELVMIHDAARPFLTVDLLDRLLVTAAAHGGSVPGVEVTDTVVEAAGDGVGRPPAGRLVRVQTPQVFATGPLLDAYESLDPSSASVDTAHVVELRSTLSVHIVDSDDRNLKVTRPEDLRRAEHLASTWLDGRWLAGDRLDG